MGLGTANKPPGCLDEPLSSREREGFRRAEALYDSLRRLTVDLGLFLRFIPFTLLLLLVALSFWLGVLLAAVGVVRLALRLVMITLLWLSGGLPPPPGGRARSPVEWIKRELRTLRVQVDGAVGEIVGPLRRHVGGGLLAGGIFWHWHLGRKAMAILVLAALTVFPWVYLIPRPHDVVITDDNATEYSRGGRLIRYLVHAADLNSPGQMREYLNEDAWWLGKVFSQRVKSQIQVGHRYRFWIVGIRWYLPTLYPNIIRITPLAGSPPISPRPGRGAVPRGPSEPPAVRSSAPVSLAPPVTTSAPSSLHSPETPASASPSPSPVAAPMAEPAEAPAADTPPADTPPIGAPEAGEPPADAPLPPEGPDVRT